LRCNKLIGLLANDSCRSVYWKQGPVARYWQEDRPVPDLDNFLCLSADKPRQFPFDFKLRTRAEEQSHQRGTVPTEKLILGGQAGLQLT